MGARYYDASIAKFISRDPWQGDLANPQSFNSYSYVFNNPMKLIDPTGMRPETEQENKVGMHIQGLWSAAASAGADSAETYRNAYNAYVGGIHDQPAGGDSRSFTIANDAMFKWYDSQMGYDGGNWSGTSPTQSSTYDTLPAGQNTCAAFVGETLADSVGYRNYAIWGMSSDGNPVNFPPNTTVWSAGNVNGFTSVGSPQMGDVVTFNYLGIHGHTGIYLGNETYVSANTDFQDGIQSNNGVTLKGVPAPTWWNPNDWFTVNYERYGR